MQPVKTKQNVNVEDYIDISKKLKDLYDKFSGDNGMSYHGLRAALELLHYEPTEEEIVHLKRFYEEKRCMCFQCFL